MPDTLAPRPSVEPSERKWATLSPDGLYRYTLGRWWGPPSGSEICWVMLNPSTANADVDDPTIRKCRGFSQRLGAAGMVVVNLFAWRATDPAELRHTHHPIGPLNDEHIDAAVNRAGTVIAAWGVHGTLHNRGLIVTAAITAGRRLHRLGAATKHGHPRHPLYVPYETELEVHR